MPITATTIGVDATLEQLRQEYNNLQADVTTLQASPTYGTSIIFEGATTDAYETTFTVVDPTADRTITLPNSTGTVLLDVAAAMANAAGPAMLNEAATTTNPTLVPNRADLDTGLGWSRANILSLIAGGSERLQITGATATFNGTLGVGGARTCSIAATRWWTFSAACGTNTMTWGSTLRDC